MKLTVEIFDYQAAKTRLPSVLGWLSYHLVVNPIQEVDIYDDSNQE